MLRQLALIGIIGLMTAGLMGQSEYAKPLLDNIPFTSTKIEKSTPDWAVELYSPNPNILKVKKLFRSWERTNKGVKNAHTRNLKHFLRQVVIQDAMTTDGYVSFPTDTEEKKAAWLKRRRSALRSSQRSNQTWTSIGPNHIPETQGRVNAQANIYSVDQSKSNPDIMFIGTETGHVFKSVDKAGTWTCMSDDYMFGGPMEVEIHPTDPNTVYLGTNHDIMKTTDGGVTWTSKRYNWSQDILSIIIHPSNPNIVLAGGDEGLFRSTNGGDTWSTITTVAVYDLKFKTDNPNVVFALFRNDVDNVIDFYRSTNTGTTFIKIVNGWDEPNSSSGVRGGRMTVSDNFGDVIYTFTGAAYTHLANSKDGIKIRKSSDGGLTWTLLVDSEQDFNRYNGSGTTRINNGQGQYDWDIEMMDSDTNMVMLGTQSKWLTNNGFSNNTLVDWGSNVGGHADLQEALFNGEDLWVASDGGLVKANNNLLGYTIKMDGVTASEFWSFDQGWNRDAQVGTLYHNGTIGRTDTYSPGIFRFFGGAEPQFSALKTPNPDKIISKGYGSVDGKSLPDNFDDPESSFNYNLLPNAYFFLSLTDEESEIEIAPYNYNIHWSGSGNILYRSEDFGVSWEEVFTGRTDGKITKIEIPKVNTEVMYVAEWHTSGYALYKSTDGGQTFNALQNLPIQAANDGIYITCDHLDEDILYIAVNKAGNANDKVWRTTNGGSTWENINATSDEFDNLSIRDIQLITGTDGGLYAITTHGVHYRNNTTDWQTCINGLPANLNIRHIKPYYKEGQVRIATMKRGVFSAPLMDQPTSIVVQPTVSVVEGKCPRDTFYFDDYSTVNHNGANWSWTIDPAPLYVDNLNIRNPKALLPANVDINVTLTIQRDGQTFTGQLDKPIRIESQCDPDDYSGYAYKMEEYGDHATTELPELTLSESTVSFWIKPQAGQLATATIFDVLSDNGTRQFCINFFGSTSNPTIHYLNGGSNAWGFNPGMSVAADEWNHIALTSSVATNDVTLYVNGESYTYPYVNAQSLDFDKLVIGWQNGWWGGRYYKGEIDELAIYNRVLSRDEIRLRMHITKDLSTDAGLIHYYQWNEGEGSTAHDKVGLSHISHPKPQVESFGPFADGTSSIQNISGSGLYNYSSEGMSMTFDPGSTYPAGDVVVTRLIEGPDVNPTTNESPQHYWVLHNFGSNQTFTAPSLATFNGYGVLSPSEVSQDFNLYTRSTGNYGSTWTSLQSIVTSVEPFPINNLNYNSSNITTSGQLTIAKDDCRSAKILSNALDSGEGNLRDLIRDACPNDTIVFSPSILNTPVTLSQGAIDIDSDIYLLGRNKLIHLIQGDNIDRIFRILDPQTRFGIENISLFNDNPTLPVGTLYNRGQLTLKEMNISGNNNSILQSVQNEGNVTVEGEVEINN